MLLYTNYLKLFIRLSVIGKKDEVHMIVYLKGNILNTPAITIVNTVNTVGVMGKGIALAIKNRYSALYEIYQKACQSKEFHIGQLMYYRAVDHDILLFPTKAHWKYPSRLKWIEDGLKAFCNDYKSYGITSIAFPMLGCGNGGLNWEEVRPLMEYYLSELPIQIFIYTGPGPNSVWLDKPIKDYGEWLHSIAMDFDENALLQRFSEYFMLPYEFYVQGKKTNMLYSPGEIRIYSDDTTILVAEDEFKKDWNKWKMDGLAACENDEKQLLYVMLCAMGYMERVYIVKEEEQKSGYQMLLMCDRAFKGRM